MSGRLMQTILLLLSLLSLGVGYVTAQTESMQLPSANWETELRRDHPLVGQIWRSANNTFVTLDELQSALTSADLVLLGEKHDNPDHHAIQQLLLGELIQSSSLQLVAFEMLTADQQDLADALDPAEASSLESLKQALNWDEQGWDWNFYGPLLQSVVAADIAVFAANISTAMMMEAYQKSLADEVLTALNQETLAQLNHDIDESHCGLLPESQFPSMVRVQQARDARMANTILAGLTAAANEETSGNLASPEGPSAVLIAGNYHIRQDLAVPNYLLAFEPGLSRDQIVSVAAIEVQDESQEPAEYLQSFNDIAAYDFIWFTPALTDEDYCSKLQ